MLKPNKFKINKKNKRNLARRGIIQTSRGQVQTPAFMPCATIGAIKGVTFEELKNMGYELILANTYHLYLRPGEKEIKKFGGLHQFINWSRPILTDSGGYQVFSLGLKRNPLQVKNLPNFSYEIKQNPLVSITQDGVWFKSHLDGSKHFLTPEKVIEIQKDLGGDIILVLDECTEYPASYKRAKESMDMTHHWAKKSIDYWQRFKHPNQAPNLSRAHSSGQAIFGIIQGSIYQDLRQESAKFISSLPFDGIAVGGVSVGEGKRNMNKVMRWLGPLLPKDKPHYLMGVGEPEDLIEAVKWGFDLFDCVLPTRLARHGTVWTTSNWQKFSKIDLRKSLYQDDKKIIMRDCECFTCQEGYSRAYLSYLIKSGEILGLRLASLHNLWLIAELIRKIRGTI